MLAAIAVTAPRLAAAGLDKDTSKFLGKIATEVSALVDGSDLAATRTPFVEVRHFAEKAKKELKKVRGALTDVASQAGVPALAVANVEEHQEILDDVREETDEDFEQAYVETVVNVLEDMIERFSEAVEDADVLAVQTFAADHLSKLRQLHERAQMLDDRLDEITDRG